MDTRVILLGRYFHSRKDKSQLSLTGKGDIKDFFSLQEISSQPMRMTELFRTVMKICCEFDNSGDWGGQTTGKRRLGREREEMDGEVLCPATGGDRDGGREEGKGRGKYCKRVIYLACMIFDRNRDWLYFFLIDKYV